MDDTAIAAAIQEKDIPAFIARLKKKYGEEFLGHSFGMLAVVRQKNSPAGIFLTEGCGSNANLFRVAHGAIRALAKQVIEVSKTVNVDVGHEHACRQVMNTLWNGIMADVGRDGVPSVFLDAPPAPPASPAA